MKLETVTGKLIDIENPDPSTIDIDDIAWGLSRIPRFCGHTITIVPYNVGQHSMFVADEVEALMDKPNYDTVLKALLHDAAEVYTGDIPSPVKMISDLRPIIKRIEAKLDAAIYQAFGLSPMTDDETKLIKYADKVAQKIEAHAFMPSRGNDWPDMPAVSLERLQEFAAPLDALQSYKMFMTRFNSLQEKRKHEYNLR